MLTWTGLSWEKKQEDWLAPVEGIVTSSWGARENPILHKEEFHDGLDIAVTEGTDVAAVKSGVVTEVRRSDTYGRVLRYRTKDGYEILYAHLSQVLVKKGERVKQGQIVARSGNTGLSTGPHLHYALRRDGKSLNPGAFLSMGEKV